MSSSYHSMDALKEFKTIVESTNDEVFFQGLLAYIDTIPDKIQRRLEVAKGSRADAGQRYFPHILHALQSHLHTEVEGSLDLTAYLLQDRLIYHNDILTSEGLIDREITVVEIVIGLFRYLSKRKDIAGCRQRLPPGDHVGPKPNETQLDLEGLDDRLANIITMQYAHREVRFLLALDAYLTESNRTGKLPTIIQAVLEHRNIHQKRLGGMSLNVETMSAKFLPAGCTIVDLAGALAWILHLRVKAKFGKPLWVRWQEYLDEDPNAERCFLRSFDTRILDTDFWAVRHTRPCDSSLRSDYLPTTVSSLAQTQSHGPSATSIASVISGQGDSVAQHDGGKAKAKRDRSVMEAELRKTMANQILGDMRTQIPELGFVFTPIRLPDFFVRFQNYIDRGYSLPSDSRYCIADKPMKPETSRKFLECAAMMLASDHPEESRLKQVADLLRLRSFQTNRSVSDILKAMTKQYKHNESPENSAGFVSDREVELSSERTIITTSTKQSTFSTVQSTETNITRALLSERFV
jgi:hypothetical protein